ncbi:hypothetical protein BH18ACT5_BH18ACT5_11630 [soil metagenome]
MARHDRWPLLVALFLTACSPSLSPTTTAGITTTAAPVTSTIPSATGAGSEPAPWGNPALLQTAAPPVLAGEWETADNSSSCAALAPEGGIAGAAPRAATFSGGWAVAWDAPDGPGMAADGTFCENCGRSAVGVAGAGVGAEESVIRSWPNVIEFDDGSIVGYGIEGGGNLVVDDPATGGVDSPTQLAFLSVTGQDCLYNIWSRRSEEELLDVIERLRFVEGLGAPTG